MSPEDNNIADAKLVANAARFGSTLDEAAAIGSRQIDAVVDYAVISTDGEIKNVWGGIPLKTSPLRFASLEDQLTQLNSCGKS